jgi:hypothetical protein
LRGGHRNETITSEGVAVKISARWNVGCQKNKPHKPPKPGKFQCRKCGAVKKKKNKLCKPEKIAG